MANEQQPEQQLSAKGAARRRFTRGGAAASGVLLTLHSQPGMAAIVCSTPSGFLSGQLSARANDPGTCAGRSPGYWKQEQKGRKAGDADFFPLTGVRRDTLFRSVFTPSSEQMPTYGADKTTLQFMLETNETWDQHNLGAHLVAVYLNVMSKQTGYLTVPVLTNIWNELRDHGVFHPTAGVDWDAYDVVQYLKGTML